MIRRFGKAFADRVNRDDAERQYFQHWPIFNPYSVPLPDHAVRALRQIGVTGNPL